MEPMRIALVAGGRSPEHEVSILSGLEVARNLDRSRYRCLPIHVDRDGIWHTAARFLADGEAPPPLLRAAASVTLGPGSAVEFCRERGVECFFLALHGPYGEDGTVQGMLELYRMPYTGPGVAASAVALDKILCRQVLSACGVPMARAWVPEQRLADALPEQAAAVVARAVGFPCFLKADRSGSSIGVAPCATPAEFAAAFEQIRAYGERWVVEAALVGVEVTCACLGNSVGPVEALPPVEIRPRHERFFNYKAKYNAEETEELCPPPSLGAAQIRAVRELALRCHRALCCDGMSRTDMIVTADGPQVLEVNTIPGLTRQSLLPKAAAVAGLSFAALIDRLIQLALRRFGHEPVGAGR